MPYQAPIFFHYVHEGDGTHGFNVGQKVVVEGENDGKHFYGNVGTIRCVTGHHFETYSTLTIGVEFDSWSDGHSLGGLCHEYDNGWNFEMRIGIEPNGGHPWPEPTFAINSAFGNKPLIAKLKKGKGFSNFIRRIESEQASENSVPDLLGG